MLTDSAIDTAKLHTKYRGHSGQGHEHHDCIRIAYEWLDAQVTIKNQTRKLAPLKHYIERWAGRYVSSSDVEVAAQMHPRIFGTYPAFNISSRLTQPSEARLSGILQAFTQDYRERYWENIYSRHELADPRSVQEKPVARTEWTA